MGSKSSSQTIGYRFRHLLFEIWAEHVDVLHRFVAGGKRAWTGCVHENQTIQIAAPAIWGDDEDNGEGGMVGPMDVQFGLADQTVNARMTTILGPRQTGNRGWFSTVFEGIFGSYVPNPKTRSVLLERIHAGWPGDEAWYPAKAPIPIFGGAESPGDPDLSFRWLATGQTASGTRAGLRPLSAAMEWVGPADVEVIGVNTTQIANLIPFDGKVYALLKGGTTRVANISDINTWTAGPTGLDLGFSNRGGASVIAGRLWVPCDTAGAAYLEPGAASFTPVTNVLALIPAWSRRVTGLAGNGPNVMCCNDAGALYRTTGGGDSWVAGANLFGTGNRFYTSNGAMDINGDRIVVAGGETSGRAFFTDDFGATCVESVLPSGTVPAAQVKYVGSNRWLIACSSGTVRLCKSVNNGQAFTAVTLPVLLSFQIQSKQNIAVDWATGKVVVAGQDSEGNARYFSSFDLEVWAEVTAEGLTNMSGIVDALPYAEPSEPPAESCPINSMNPAHIIRYMLTQKKQIPDAMLSEASFTYAADVLFAEGFGLCEEFDPDQETPEAFILRICDIIGACCTQSKTDGLIYLDLLRNDYDKETLPELTDDDIVDWQDEQAVPAELTNSVQIGWRDVLVDNGLERITPPIKALGHIRTHGREMNQVIDMRGIPFENIAMRVAKRELDARSKPLVRLTITTRRKHTSLRPGQPLLINCPKRGRVDMVVRVGEVDHGTPTDARMRWVLLQDVFDLPATVEIDPTTVHDPDDAPAEADAEIAIEAPYVELVATLTAEQMAALGEEAGYLLTGVTAPTRGTNYAIHSKLASEAYERRAFADFTPSALTYAEALPLDGAVQLVSGNLLSRVEVGSWALWEDEIIRVDGIDEDGILTMGRSCADTVPAKHDPGTRIFFLGDWNGTDRREYASGDELAVKLPIRTGPDEQDLADKTELEVTFAQRQFRPYPPGNLMLNGEPFYGSGAVVVSPPGGGGGGGGGPTSPPALTPYGIPASRETGLHGGFPDDALPEMSTPSVFGVDIISALGEFSDADALAAWTQSNGSPVSGWSIDSGRAKYSGIQGINSIAYLRPAQLRMPYLPFPRYNATIAADVQTLAGTYASIGFPGHESTPAEYLTETNVSFTYAYAQTYGTVTIPLMLPTINFTGPSLLTGWYDNVTVVIEEVPVDVTAETPDHIDFDLGLTGWTAYPPGGSDVFELSESGGEITHGFLTTYADQRILYCDDPLSLADAIGKYIHVIGEVWCDDPSVRGGVTSGGAAFGVVIRNSTTGELITPFSYFGQPERGDWTEREFWYRQHTVTPGLEFHVAVLLTAAPGYLVKVRGFGVEVTDAVVD